MQKISQKGFASLVIITIFLSVLSIGIYQAKKGSNFFINAQENIPINNPKGWDYNLTKRCVKSLTPGSLNYFTDPLSQCSDNRHWLVAVQNESRQPGGENWGFQSCPGPNVHSFKIRREEDPIDPSTPNTIGWGDHLDESGRANKTVHLKTDLYNFSYPNECGTDNYNFFVLMDHANGGGERISRARPDELKFSAQIYFNEFVPSGANRLLIMWQGIWDEGERPVVNGTTLTETAHEIEVNLTLTGWGDDYPHDPDLIQIFKNRDIYGSDDAAVDARSPQIARFIKVDGKTFDGNFPRNKLVEVVVDFAGLINYLVNKDEQNKNGIGLTGRKVLIPPVSGSWEGSKTTAIGIGTEAHSVSVSGGPIADLYFTNWREESSVLSSSPAPSASALITLKNGDTDNDGDIDIYDYNLVVTDFGKVNDPDTKADLDSDNDVDIYDYNLVVTYFGN